MVQVRTDQEERKEWERQEEIRKKQEKENRIKREFERRMNPKSKEDFDLLYHALESEYLVYCKNSVFKIDTIYCILCEKYDYFSILNDSVFEL